MNPATDPLQPPPPPPPAAAAAAGQPQQLLQPHRSSFSCDKHPEENFTGFCPLCLCERLTTLDQSSNAAASSSSRRPSTSSISAAAAIKSLFKLPQTASNNNPSSSTNTTSKIKTSFFPELRRTKSFSASKNEGFSGVFEPQRKSCDVRGGKNTLWTLFSIDDENKPSTSLAGAAPVLEDKDECYDNEEELEEVEEEGEEEEEDEAAHEEPINYSNNNLIISDHDDEIRVCEDEPNVTNFEETAVPEPSLDDLKTMKDHIDLDSQAKKPALSNFWSAASVFSKKWHKWRRKQKLKKRENDNFNDISSMALPIKKRVSRQFRDTQSEIADYGFGRRSCDTDPRFSLDVGRISFDDPRYSFDQPRASWDGHLIGRTFPRLPPMVEDAPVVHVARIDTLIPVEQPDENVPGGSIQTREYYSDSSSKRRKSLDRSNSIRKTAAAVVAEIDEMKGGTLALNGKVSPETIDYLHAAKILEGERGELIRDSNSNSLRDDRSETFELGIKDNGSVISGGGGEGEKKGSKKSRRWSWKLWGFIHRRGGGGNKDEEERFSRVNGVERSFSESWQDMRREGGNGDGKNGLNRRVLRSNSSVSWRNSYNVGGSFGSVRRSSFEMNANGNGNGNGNGHVNGNGNVKGIGIGIGNVKKKRDEFVLERNRSARYSPTNHVDNGLLRFYLTPLRGSRRGGGGGGGGGGGVGSGKSKANNSHSFARNMMGLY